MTSSDDHSPPRRPIFFPVVIATVFLTIIGMTSGFVLGERHRDQLRVAQETPTTGVVTGTYESSAPSGPLCPDETLQTATEKGLPSDLRRIFKVTTENDTVVWICQDGAGSLYFQSKTHQDDGRLIQGRNGLFLTQVVRDGEDEYRATATNGNVFVVSLKRLEVRFADGRKTQVNAVSTVG
ncbi:hypothetical protein [Actinoplanes sp. NPDC026619]|uniref:hypothetical protein n=1 Tax=Actinoplanes sp. NPDC026619 TaxID=3155798 RepID=UPI0033F8C7BA